MKKRNFKYLPIVLMGLIGISTSAQQAGKENKLLLSDGWLIKSTLEVKEEATVVSSGNFKPVDWYKTSVPTTVLNALVKNNVYPDPRFGMDNFKIPDVSDEFNQKHDLGRFSYLKDKKNPWKDPYWFRKEFNLPVDYSGKQIWINFDGINYRADVWINGHQIADHQDMAGMFQRFKFNISKFAKPGSKNTLAVKIYQVDHPGTPNPGIQNVVFGPNRGHAEDIFKDETLKFSGGWDCAPVVRDRNMGIYQDVYITSSGNITINDSYVTTDLPLPDTTSADIRITTEIRNSGNLPVDGIVEGQIDLVNTLEFPNYSKFLGGSMPSILIKKKLKLNAGETVQLTLDPHEFPQLSVRNPYLWWPNGYGKQYLHRLKLSFKAQNQVSDYKEITFGIREVSNELKKIGNEYGRVFIVNGQRIFCKGGWIQPDMLLDMNEKRVYDEARLLALANVNMLGNEDAPSPAENIMDTYDKYGLMVWETFYQCWRMYPGTETANNPIDHKLALREARDILKRYRNHPSLVIWCAANETTVAEDLYTDLRKSVRELDPSRPFIPCTSYDWDVDKLTPYIKADLPLGTTDDGAPDYNWNPEPYYFNKILEVNKQTFRNELGSPAVPTFSSLKKFMPDLAKGEKSVIYPLDSVWAEHGAWDDNNYVFRAYDQAIRNLYGSPASVEDYVQKAQYINATSYRAMYEAANHRMWNITSGVMLWKLNSCWPDVAWQIYDWYLNQNAAYFFARKAMEPVHIQMNANDNKVSLINTRRLPLNQHIVSAKVVDFNMQTIWSRTDTLNFGADMYTELYSIPQNLKLTPVYFVKLEFKNPAGDLISDNLYWLSSKQPNDFSELTKLPPVELMKTVNMEEKGNEYAITVKLKNPSGGLSFFNRLYISRTAGGDEVLPVFWDNNYFSLFPQEEIVVKAVVSKEDMNGFKPFVNIEGSKSMYK